MSKNCEEKANYYLYIDGQAVPVSEEIYRVYQHYERKEEYFSYDLKTEKFQKETATFLPNREDSYERLLEKARQFAASGMSVEEQAVSSVWLEELLQCLSADERVILHKLYFEDKSERNVSIELGISKTALHHRKVKLLQKLKKLLENMGKS
ncbi:sigma-70 family RNA polymerase sigma factor [Flavonifractor sp. An306]|uniref:sigma-70 family RNA polymerase sigma factor n=1 Tax=Flavonifractor sp. An306 TaxID=1965629 RepID=UPI0017493A28|nr:sigma-70 family RNA polymerase sigma factor [Flavonifractor sp. An306]